MKLLNMKKSGSFGPKFQLRQNPLQAPRVPEDPISDDEAWWNFRGKTL
jgi:hypothetical protein